MVLLRLQNYGTQMMDYFKYDGALRRVSCGDEWDVVRLMNRLSCGDPDPVTGVSLRYHPLRGKFSFKLLLDQTSPGSSRTRVVAGVAGLFDTAVLTAVRETLGLLGVSVRDERLSVLSSRIGRLRLMVSLTLVTTAGAAVAGMIALGV